jgi:hypothetical protein
MLARKSARLIWQDSVGRRGVSVTDVERDKSANLFGASKHRHYVRRQLIDVPLFMANKGAPISLVPADGITDEDQLDACRCSRHAHYC